MTSLCTAKMKVEATEEKRHCNIPKVRFLGTLRDWLLLRKKITYLDRYGCHKWLDSMLPVINKFIKAIEEDEIDKEFWESMYEIIPGKHAGQANKVHGWIVNFFPFTAMEQKQNFSFQHGATQLFKDRGCEPVKNMMDEDDFYRGVTA